MAAPFFHENQLGPVEILTRDQREKKAKEDRLVKELIAARE